MTYGFSWKFHVISCHKSKFVIQIHTKFHEYSMSFPQVLFVFHAAKWHGFWTSSSHGISMVFAKKLMGFPSDLVSFPTKLPSKREEKIRVTFFTGYIYMEKDWGERRYKEGKVINRYQILWPHQIPCHLSRFYLFYARTLNGFWISSSHGISMVFAKKMMGFPSDLVSFSTKLPSTRHEKILSHFLQGN